MIFIDEYDHFATNIIENPGFFCSVTGRDGFVRRFYEVIKDHTGTGCVDRMFITGVTSMTLDSLTSGFNIGKNISMDPRVNAMAGFMEAETEGCWVFWRPQTRMELWSGSLPTTTDMYSAITRRRQSGF